ncbi:methylated-DNA--[protein]-cysteine S-methyltransferase [Homoserinimonas sp. OAct 916]|uniref:methylated-DNA--[protein]-cysteine S-methyltransferase n=1 Tax=Homoserinimonas sp. OAct 916 TaxID=2211450 RepID=UPI000DBE1DC8|nr:methylated-DNA--[protein]-cysteine S-methyltransferase [Homoserinimonas sp. OAct 916]
MSTETTPDPPLHRVRIDSPIGRIQLTGSAATLDGVAVERDGALPLDHLPENSSRVLCDTARQLDRYFDGRRVRFTAPRRESGTPFQNDVWQILGALSWGEVITYGEIGRRLGRPTAGRAVGSAVRANPFPIIVGCHRVLAADGAITGYSQGAGVPTKIWLLDHEGIVHTQVSSQAK